jgi:hypothetical protein
MPQAAAAACAELLETHEQQTSNDAMSWCSCYKEFCTLFSLVEWQALLVETTPKPEHIQQHGDPCRSADGNSAAVTHKITASTQSPSTLWHSFWLGVAAAAVASRCQPPIQKQLLDQSLQGFCSIEQCCNIACWPNFFTTVLRSLTS